MAAACRHFGSSAKGLVLESRCASTLIFEGSFRHSASTFLPASITAESRVELRSIFKRLLSLRAVFFRFAFFHQFVILSIHFQNGTFIISYAIFRNVIHFSQLMNKIFPCCRIRNISFRVGMCENVVQTGYIDLGTIGKEYGTVFLRFSRSSKTGT